MHNLTIKINVPNIKNNMNKVHLSSKNNPSCFNLTEAVDCSLPRTLFSHPAGTSSSFFLKVLHSRHKTFRSYLLHLVFLTIKEVLINCIQISQARQPDLTIFKKSGQAEQIKINLLRHFGFSYSTLH